MNVSSDKSMENVPPNSTTNQIVNIMTNEQKEAMEKALFNPLILHKIVNCMDFPELKMCRKVKKSWNSVSTEMMEKRDCCIVRICFSKYRQIDREGGPQRLVELNDILDKATTNFPCSDFQFKWGDLASPEVQNFFKIHGKNIKSLSLVQFSTSNANPEYHTSKTTFCQVLLDLAPNVATLYLNNFDYDSWTEDNKLLLPSLKILKWTGSTSSTALKILQGAKNLEMIPVLLPSQENLDVLVKSGKADVAGLVVRFGENCPRRIGLLSRLTSLGPKLQEFVLFSHIVVDSWKTAFEKILESTADTLKCLTIKGTNSVVNLPKLKNLHTLALNGTGHYGRLFPIRINLLDTFQKVKVLDLTSLTKEYSDDNWNVLFPPPDAYQGNFPAVKILKISHRCSELWMNKFLILCPNFKDLVVTSADQNNYFDTLVLSSIFELWSHLESIEVILVQGAFSSSNSFFMDHAITGISNSTCRQLRFFKSLGFVKGFEDYATAPSIRNVKGLKTFLIRLGGSVTILPFSCVAGMYSFNLMPDLKVTLQFDHRKLSKTSLQLFYDELASHVNIRHST